MAQKAVSSSDVEDFVILRKELSRYIGTLNLEREAKVKISRYLQEAQETISRSVKLDPEALSASFPGTDGAVLEDGKTLVLSQGPKKVSLSLFELEEEPYMAVVKELGKQVARLMSEADARRELEVMPVLQADLQLSGRRLGLIDRRAYTLVVSNAGGPVRRMKLTVTSDGDQAYRAFDLGKMQKKEIALRGYAKISRAPAITLRVAFEDVDGRPYSGSVELRPGSGVASDFELVQGRAFA